MIEVRTAHEAIQKTMDYIIANGFETDTWGGEIPAKIGDPNSPNDFNRKMLECEPLVIKLTDPLARWCDWSSQSVGITLRETEDSLQGYNPGHVIKYSKLYRVWLNKKNYFDYTYGERVFSYPYNPNAFMFDRDRTGFNLVPINQFQCCIDLLKKHPTTRKAVINVGFPFVDQKTDYRPCNQLFQLRIVDGKLNWITVVRSLDVLRGFTENIFMFSLFQEMAAHQLEVPVGTYTTIALNPHLYADQIEKKQHIQKIDDCYKYFTPKPATFPFPSNEFEAIDASLFQTNDIDQTVEFCMQLPEYWSNWKLALVAEWVRLFRKDNKKAEEITARITNEFRYPVARRLEMI